ncbi:WxL domain-containing protein [Cytobacillus kochii]|uniref:WxL domain-containing protein n=1 Tax=Cytobacillus kochii TaxID=859143 RepID=UPI002480E1F7|nr:WxL domain-containing protein [Cytobacillus kochii]
MKKLCKMFAVSTLTGCLALTGITTSFAAESQQAKRDIDASIVKGDLTLSAPSNKPFGSVQLENNPKTIQTNLNDFVQVSDLRGTQEGWRLDVSATQFEIKEPQGGFAAGTTAEKLPTGSLSLSEVEDIARVGVGSSKLPSSIQTSKKILDDGSLTVAEANQGEGMGVFNINFENNAFSLVVDATTAKIDMVNYPDGNTPYQSIVNWNLVSAP